MRYASASGLAHAVAAIDQLDLGSQTVSVRRSAKVLEAVRVWERAQPAEAAALAADRPRLIAEAKAAAKAAADTPDPEAPDPSTPPQQQQSQQQRPSQPVPAPAGGGQGPGALPMLPGVGPHGRAATSDSPASRRHPRRRHAASAFPDELLPRYRRRSAHPPHHQKRRRSSGRASPSPRASPHPAARGGLASVTEPATASTPAEPEALTEPPAEPPAPHSSAAAPDGPGRIPDEPVSSPDRILPGPVQGGPGDPGGPGRMASGACDPAVREPRREGRDRLDYADRFQRTALAAHRRALPRLEAMETQAFQTLQALDTWDSHLAARYARRQARETDLRQGGKRTLSSLLADAPPRRTPAPTAGFSGQKLGRATTTTTPQPYAGRIGGEGDYDAAADAALCDARRWLPPDALAAARTVLGVDPRLLFSELVAFCLRGLDVDTPAHAALQAQMGLQDERAQHDADRDAAAIRSKPERATDTAPPKPADEPAPDGLPPLAAFLQLPPDRTFRCLVPWDALFPDGLSTAAPVWRHDILPRYRSAFERCFGAWNPDEEAELWKIFVVDLALAPDEHVPFPCPVPQEAKATPPPWPALQDTLSALLDTEAPDLVHKMAAAVVRAGWAAQEPGPARDAAIRLLFR